jgi:hypothetical protein
MRAMVVLALAAGLAAAPQTQAPVRTGLIVGQVIEAGSNRPVPEAIVTLTGSGPRIDPRDRGRRVMADSDGRYFFGELSPGTYTIRAVKAGYPQNFVGNTQVSTASVGSIELAAGERRGDANILLWRFATLSGTVLDEAGEPVVGVEVRALRRTFSAGRTRFVSTNGATSSTDDRGVFRLAELRPGGYVVVVPSSQTTLPVAIFEKNLWQNSDEVRSATSSIQVLGYSQNQQIDSFVLLTQQSITWPPAPTESGRLSVYPVTFHPGTSSSAEATVFALGPGEERSAGTIQLKPVPSVRVSGRLMGPTGPAALTALRLMPAAENQAQIPWDPVTGVTDQNGEFTLLGVPAGSYTLRVMSPRITGGPIPPSTPDKPILWGSEPVTVADSDVTGLAVTLRHTFLLSGRLEFRGTKPPPENMRESVYVGVDPASGNWGGASTSPDATGTFATGVAGGSYYMTVEGPPGWYLKGVMADGRDISDVPLDVKGNVLGVVVVFTDETSEISGTVRTARGAAESAATVVTFPTDRRLWSGYGSRFPRRVVSTPVGPSGSFALRALPPGEYFVAAIPDSLVETWRDPKVLEDLARMSSRVSLAENEKRSLDLRVTGAR